MKKLLLLSAFLIFACSSDDSSDSDLMEETFLERYDGVVWEANEGTTVYIRFNNDTLNWLTSYEFNDDEIDGQYECHNLTDHQEPIFSILINSGDNFTYSVQYSGEELEVVYFTVIDNGNILEIVNPSHNIQATFLRSNLTEIPCD